MYNIFIDETASRVRDKNGQNKLIQHYLGKTQKPL